MRPIDASAHAFTDALARVRAASIRPEFLIEEGPAPQRLAPHAVAITAEMADLDDDRASGRFVLLHDPDGVDEWDGTFRAVIFARAELEHDVATDPMLQEVAWTWLLDAMVGAGAVGTHVGGTVTVTSGASFGSMADRPAESFVEIRASWTPLDIDGVSVPDTMDRHVHAWIDVMAQAAGLAPMPRGISHVGSGRRRTRA
ncbi:MAG: DUF3000 domain-containing protein [Candidatus Nanopelagicales bacterium]